MSSALEQLRLTVPNCQGEVSYHPLRLHALTCTPSYQCLHCSGYLRYPLYLSTFACVCATSYVHARKLTARNLRLGYFSWEGRPNTGDRTCCHGKPICRALQYAGASVFEHKKLSMPPNQCEINRGQEVICGDESIVGGITSPHFTRRSTPDQ